VICKSFDLNHSQRSSSTKFVNIIPTLHYLLRQVTGGGQLCGTFDINNWNQHDCVLAPLLFSIFSTAMWCYSLLVAFKDCDIGIPVRLHTDGSVLNHRRPRIRIRSFVAVTRDLLHADPRLCTASTHWELCSPPTWLLPDRCHQLGFDSKSNEERSYAAISSMLHQRGRYYAVDNKQLRL